METESAVREREETRLAPPGEYNVVMYNDDVTPFSLVMMILVDVFGYEKEAALMKTDGIQASGSGVVGAYIKSVAELKVELCHKITDAAGYPLRVEIKEA